MILKTFNEFLNEEHNKIVKFSSVYTFTLEWWAIWQEKYKDIYSIKQDAINKIYTIYDLETNIPIFIFDYEKRINLFR